MSHFCVAVFSDGTKSLEELLEPYQENNFGTVDSEYLQFESVTETYYKDYKNDTIKKVKLSDGSLLDSSKCFREITKEEYDRHSKLGNKVYETFIGGHKYLLYDPEHFGGTEVDIPVKEIYPCFEDYMISYVGATYDDEMHDWGYWKNPNAKWDWYEVGGRFMKSLKVYDEPGSSKSTVYKSAAKVKEFDFSPDEETYQKAIRWWEVVIENSPLKEGEKREDFFQFYKKEYYLERYKNKETYAKIESSFVTFAVVLPDGQWIEKGEMGWWGMSFETDEESYDWDMHYKDRFLDTADPEWTLYIVDCHI